MLKVGFSESTMFKEVRPLWGQKIRANESRGQTCLDYAKCSRIWRNSENCLAIFTGGLDKDGRAQHAPFGGGKIIFQMILRGIRQCLRLQSKRRRSRLYPLFYISSNQKPLGTGQVGYDACKKTIAGKHGFGFFCQITVQFEKGRSVRR